MSSVAVVATVEAGNVPPRVRLNITDSGTPAITNVTVTRLDPDGSISSVRTQDGQPLVLTTSGSTRVGLIYDYEMPLGQPVTYSTAETPANTSGAVTVTVSRAWLVHTGVPALSLPILLASIGARSRKIERGVFQPMGRRNPIVVTSGQRAAGEFSMSVTTQSAVEKDAIDSLIDDAGTLLLNVPLASAWGFTSEYVAVGDATENRISRIVSESWRTWDFPCTVVDRPVGGSQSLRTYADLLTFATYADLRAAYSTYSAALAGP